MLFPVKLWMPNNPFPSHNWISTSKRMMSLWDHVASDLHNSAIARGGLVSQAAFRIAWSFNNWNLLHVISSTYGIPKCTSLTSYLSRRSYFPKTGWLALSKLKIIDVRLISSKSVLHKHWLWYTHCSKAYVPWLLNSNPRQEIISTHRSVLDCEFIYQQASGGIDSKADNHQRVQYDVQLL